MKILIILISLVSFVACTSSTQKQKAVLLVHADSSATAKTKTDSIKPIALTKAQKDSAYNDSIAQEIVNDTLFALPEIKRFAEQLDSESHDSVHAEIIIDPPTSSDPYYFAHVGFSDNNMYHTMFSFNAKVKGKRVTTLKFYDVVNDTSISLAEWRRQERNRPSN